MSLGPFPALSMSTRSGSLFYCHACASSHGLFSGLNLVGPSPSAYQTAKAHKHVGLTSPSTGINSVLNSRSTAEYDQYARKALQEGFVEVEANGVRAVVVQSTGYLGTQFNAAVPTNQWDSFRWVLSSDPTLAHGRPDSSTAYSGVKCAGCGCALTS